MPKSYDFIFSHKNESMISYTLFSAIIVFFAWALKLKNIDF